MLGLYCIVSDPKGLLDSKMRSVLLGWFRPRSCAATAAFVCHFPTLCLWMQECKHDEIVRIYLLVVSMNQIDLMLIACHKCFRRIAVE